MAMFSRLALLGVLILAGLRLAAAEPPAGRAVYLRACAHCHGAEGEGWREKNGPTLRQTDWVTGDADRLIRVTLSGLFQRIPLKNGTHYGSMPGHRAQLDDGEIAAVLTYLRQAWDNQAPPVPAARVAALRPEANSRQRPWTAAEFGLEAKPKLGKNGEALEQPDPFAAAGFKVYEAICQNCHQPDGRGIVTEDGHGYPPLVDSDFVNGPPPRLIRVVLGGLQGDIMVRGKRFSEVMPPWHAALDDQQVAQVLTFIRQSWSNLAPPIRPEQVGQLRAESVARSGVPWTAKELEQVAAAGAGAAP
jgi:mono/diheme cytochrome c family protein